MSNIQKVFQKAIRKKQAIKIYLTSQTNLEGCIPVHLVFWNPETETKLEETAHHENSDEVEVHVDNETEPYIAWTSKYPNSEVIGVHFDYEGIARDDAPVYAFLDTDTEVALEMERIREEFVYYLKNVFNEEWLEEEVEEDDDFFYSILYKMR